MRGGSLVPREVATSFLPMSLMYDYTPYFLPGIVNVIWRVCHRPGHEVPEANDVALLVAGAVAVREARLVFMKAQTVYESADGL